MLNFLGLVCKGNGITATRKIDVDTGDIAHSTTKEWAFADGWGCDPDTCEQYLDKQCRQVMNLLFMMPDVPGLGCWQLDTTKKTVHVLFIRSEVKLADLQRLALVPPERIALPTVQEEEPPEDLFPEQVIKAEAASHEAKEEAPPPEPVEQKTPDDVVAEDVPDLDAVFRICHNIWKMQPFEICKQLGHGTTKDTYDAYKGKSGWEPFLTIKNIKQPEEPPEEPAASQEERLTEEEELEQAPFLK